MKRQTTVLEVGSLHGATSESVIEKTLLGLPGALAVDGPRSQRDDVGLHGHRHNQRAAAKTAQAARAANPAAPQDAVRTREPTAPAPVRAH